MEELLTSADPPLPCMRHVAFYSHVILSVLFQAMHFQSSPVLHFVVLKTPCVCVLVVEEAVKLTVMLQSRCVFTRSKTTLAFLPYVVTIDFACGQRQ